MKKKEILIIISCFFPIIGGAEKQLYLIGRTLVKKGFNVTVMTRKYKNLKLHENIDGINIVRIPFINIGGILSKISIIFNSLLYLIVSKKYDAVITSQIGTCPTIASVYKKIYSIPFTCRMAGNELEPVLNSKRQYTKFNNCTKGIDKFIAINEKIYGQLSQIGIVKEKIVSITNGVEIKAKTEILKNKNIIYCGRIEHIKGVDILLKAWEIVEKEDTSLRLSIIGDGSEKNKLQKDFSHLKNINWVGEVSNPHIYYDSARIMVAPSRSEGISNSILEGMSKGIPIIATNVGGTPELIKNKETGILIESNESEILAKEIISLYYDKSTLEYISSQSYNYIYNNYSITKAADTYIKLINSL